MREPIPDPMRPARGANMGGGRPRIRLEDLRRQPAEELRTEPVDYSSPAAEMSCARRPARGWRRVLCRGIQPLHALSRSCSFWSIADPLADSVESLRGLTAGLVCRRAVLPFLALVEHRASATAPSGLLPHERVQQVVELAGPRAAGLDVVQAAARCCYGVLAGVCGHRQQRDLQSRYLAGLGRAGNVVAGAARPRSARGRRTWSCRSSARSRYAQLAGSAEWLLHTSTRLARARRSSARRAARWPGIRRLAALRSARANGHTRTRARSRRDPGARARSC